MTSLEKALRDFAQFAAKLKGDEKSEAHTFLFHLLAAFGHDPNTLPEGSTFEYRVRFPGERTKYADFVWPGRCLIEMKSRGVKLSKHYQQTFDYWGNLVPHRPRYVVLCNFDEFWIYDFDTQVHDPVDRVPVADLPARHAALNFLFPRAFQPLFGHNWVEVTRAAAKDVANAFNSLVFRGEDRVRARRFILQCVVAMFAEDIGLLPQDLFTHLLDECRRGASSYDLIGGLFRQMNDSNPARAGRYAGVDYFNGGLFANIDPIELTLPELGPLFAAANENNWGYVQPVIFGTLFESSLGKEERHALGAHFTYESDIQKIVRPTIVRPWDKRIRPGGRAGLVGTKTVRQSESRMASLDYITGNGGTITEAVSKQVWSGEAAVHVSIINWIKGEQAGRKRLFTQVGDNRNSDWKCEDLDYIGPTLASSTDATQAKSLRVNQEPKCVYVGQYPFNEGFWLAPEEAAHLLQEHPEHKDVLFPYMIGRDLVETGRPSRWIIDFAQREMTAAMRYEAAFERVKKMVMPVVLAKGARKRTATGKESTRWSRLSKRWWQLRDYQPGTMAAIARVPRYIACSRVTKRPIFEFLSPGIHPDNTLMVFSLADDYSFGVLQSGTPLGMVHRALLHPGGHVPLHLRHRLRHLPLAAVAHTRPGQSGRRSRRFPARLAPRDHGRQRLVPARPLSRPRNPRHQPPPRRPSRPRLRRPRRLPDEGGRGRLGFAPQAQPRTGQPGIHRRTDHAARSPQLRFEPQGVHH